MTKKEVTTDPTPQSGQRKVSIVFTGCQKEPWFFGKRLINHTLSGPVNYEILRRACKLRLYLYIGAAEPYSHLQS